MNQTIEKENIPDRIQGIKKLNKKEKLHINTWNFKLLRRDSLNINEKFDKEQKENKTTCLDASDSPNVVYLVKQTPLISVLNSVTARTVDVTAIFVRAITNKWTIIAYSIKVFVFHWHYHKCIITDLKSSFWIFCNKG